MPVLDGKFRNSSMAASNPPAEPPIPTIGQLKFLLLCFEVDFALADFDCGDLVLLVFARERNARLFAVCFAAMTLFMLIPSRASYKLPFSRWHPSDRCCSIVSSDDPMAE